MTVSTRLNFLEAIYSTKVTALIELIGALLASGRHGTAREGSKVGLLLYKPPLSPGQVKIQQPLLLLLKQGYNRHKKVFLFKEQLP